MTKQVFINIYCHFRDQWLHAEVKNGTMRLSEMAMTSAGAPKEAAKLWRKHRATYRIARPEDIWPGRVIPKHLKEEGK